jgi:hypothetical protein
LTIDYQKRIGQLVTGYPEKNPWQLEEGGKVGEEGKLERKRDRVERRKGGRLREWVRACLCMR